jgi:hypothetical protein
MDYFKSQIRSTVWILVCAVILAAVTKSWLPLVTAVFGYAMGWIDGDAYADRW